MSDRGLIMTMVETFKRGNVRYLALDRVTAVEVLDTTGGYYGSWHTVESFLKALKDGRADTIGTVARIDLLVR